MGAVNDKNRYALEIAAGNRLGQIVVDNDTIASKAIEILKKKKAGRLTFLPLNRIKTNKKNFALTRFENSKENGFIDKAINLIDCDGVYADVFKYVFGDTLVFSDLESAKLFKEKIRMVTLSGELLEVSGAITGGSKVNKDLAYRFGTNNDIDEAQPIKQRLFVIEEALRKSANDILNKTNNLNKLNFNQREILEDCVSSNKEIEVNNNSLKVSMKRIDDNNLRLNKLTSQNNLLKEKLDSIQNEIKPYKKKLDELEMILKKNHEDNQTSSLMTHNNDFEKLDKKLESMIQEKDELLNKKNQFVLNQERINNQLNLISLSTRKESTKIS